MTAVEWLVANLFVYGMPDQRCIELVKKAKEMEKQQIEISDDEIEKYASDFYNDNGSESIFILGAKWYREQLKSRQ